MLLRHALTQRIGDVSLDDGYAMKLWLSALVSGGLAFAPKVFLPSNHPIFQALIVLTIYGASYFGATFFLGIEESQKAFRRSSRVKKRRY